MAYKNKSNKNKSKFNKDSKNKLKDKKDSKQQGKSSNNTDQKPYYPDYSQNLSLISRLRAGKPGSIVKVRHFEVGAVDVGTIEYLKSQITSAINTLATQRGYQSTVDFSVVEGYVDQLIDLEIAAATFVRTQNLVKIEDVLGTPVGDAFYKISRDYAAKPSRYYDPDEFKVKTGFLKAVFAEAVTNHAYSTEFVSPMSKLLTTPHLHAQIASYFGVIHADMESDDDSVFNVLWNEDTPVTFSELKTLISNTKTFILTYPDLELILRSIGFSSFEEIGEEFHRDRIQQSVTIRNDGFFEAMLHNSKVNIEIVRTANSPAEVLYTTNSAYPDTFLNDVSVTLTSIDPQASGISAINKVAYVTLKMFATGMVYRNYNIVSRQKNGNIYKAYFKTFPSIEKWNFDSNVIGAPNGLDTGKIDAAYLSNLFSNFKDRDMSIPDDGTLEIYLETEPAVGPIPAGITASIQNAAESPLGNDGGNRLSVSDALDASLYLDNRKVFLLYGTVE